MVRGVASAVVASRSSAALLSTSRTAPVRGRRRLGRLAFLSVACVVGGLVAICRGLGMELAEVSAVGSTVGSDMVKHRADIHLLQLLRSLSAEVEKLWAQVDCNQLVSHFGAKANVTLAKAHGVPEVEKVVESALRALFLRQIVLLRQQVAKKFEEAEPDIGTVAKADQEFVKSAEELICPGRDWSYELERFALRSWLEGVFRRDAALAEERAQAARLQQTTIRVISKLQTQMEALQQKAQGMRSGGSPLVLSTSYRIPKSPLHLCGRYERGRASIELNLSPTKDPSGAAANIVEGMGPANLGVSFNVGV